jgi:hypothetical protein
MFVATSNRGLPALFRQSLTILAVSVEEERGVRSTHLWLGTISSQSQFASEIPETQKGDTSWITA